MNICQDEIRRKKSEKKKKKLEIRCTGYYAVSVGRINDCIVGTWEECKSLTHYYPKAVFKKFDTLKEAENFLKKCKKGKK